MKFEVDFYKTQDGRCPVQEFLDSLDHKMRAKLLRTIMLLEQNGNELRAKQGSNITRVLYFFVIGERIILTNGFIKKTQKTSQNQIDLAKRCRQEYLDREER